MSHHRHISNLTRNAGFEHQLNAMVSNPEGAFEAALHHPGSHLLILGTGLVLAVGTAWVIVSMLGGFGKILMPSPADKRSSYGGGYDEPGCLGNALVISFLKYAAPAILIFAFFAYYAGPAVQNLILGMPTG